MLLHPGQHLVDLAHLPGAHRLSTVEQERVRLVEDQHGLRLARALERLGDVLLRPADIGRQQVRGALLEDLEPEPAREIAGEGGFAGAGRAGQAEREGEVRTRGDVLDERGEIHIGAGERRIEVGDRDGRAGAAARQGADQARGGALERVPPAAGELGRTQRILKHRGGGGQAAGEIVHVVVVELDLVAVGEAAQDALALPDRRRLNSMISDMRRSTAASISKMLLEVQITGTGLVSSSRWR